MSTTTSPNDKRDLPPVVRISALTWMREQLFSSPLNALLTVLSVWLLMMSLPALFEWAFVNANVSATRATCRRNFPRALPRKARAPCASP